jgi:catalase
VTGHTHRQSQLKLTPSPTDTPSALSGGFPAEANQTVGRGFFTTPGRTISGALVRGTSPTFSDHWSQPRLFYNSLIPAEQQFLINAIRFETSHLTSTVVKQNVLTQLNKISHDIASRVAVALGSKQTSPELLVSPYLYRN